MKLNKIILSNIGAYLGHYEIDLTVTSPIKNLILFGGKNGSGKTTLLESVRLALFGPYTYGFRTVNDQYLGQIQPLLNKTAVSNNENLYRIILEFERVEDYVPSTYTVKRSWSIENNRIKETLEILKDNQFLSERENEIFQARIREEMPPQLFELCLFDGEEISRIITDGKLSNYIGHSARVLFSLDLFENLEQDIGQYMKQATANGNKSELQIELERLEDELTVNEEASTSIKQAIQILSREIEETQNKVYELKNDFDIHGGLAKEKRDELVSMMNELEFKRKENIEKVRSFITGLLPMYLNKDLLLNVQDQMKKEHENENFEFITSKLKTEKLSPLVDQLKKLGLNVNHDDTSVEDLLINEVLSSLKPEDSTLIHRASFTQRSEIQSLIHQLDNVDEQEYISIFKENQNMLKEIYHIRKQIEENDKNHDFTEMFDQIQILNEQIEKAKLNKEQKETELIDIESKISQLKQDLERQKTKVIDSTKSENTLSLSLKISEVSKRFRNLQIRKKLRQVEFEATRMIKQLFSKENFIHQTSIEPNTFNVTLLTSQQEEIDQHKISAGEKQLLLLAIIWAMFKTSGSRMPFIFDTLLGRLDQTHKERLLTKLIPNFGEQVIILSTDSEIDVEHVELIKPILSKTYTLTYDKEHRKAQVIKNKYFDVFETEMRV